MAEVRTRNTADEGEEPFVDLELLLTEEEISKLNDGGLGFSLEFDDPIERPEIHTMTVTPERNTEQ